MNEAKKATAKKSLENGMYNCTMKSGEKRVYHSSTAETLQTKGLLKVDGKIKVYKPKTMKS